LDAIFAKVRLAGRIVPVTIAIGVDNDRRRDVISEVDPGNWTGS